VFLAPSKHAAPAGARRAKEPGRLRYCLVGSSGGHLLQLWALRPIWGEHDRCWVTFDKEDAASLLEGERAYAAAFPSNRNIPNLLRNFRIAWRVLRRERPDVIVSTGAGVAIPFFVLGRLFGAKLVYLEVYDRIDSATLTGRACQPFAHIFALQWEEQRRFYPRGQVVGKVL
jgi:beta-1,4-N-acetylglucosaminyltransferase